uniref:Uncharacterized protein n=1 Tax=Mesocestoides corti TaxID=53468 RepID=A0A5K3FQU4_MESCO
MRHSDPVVDANMYQQARNRRPPPFPPPPQPHRLRHERGRQADDLSSEFYSPPATPLLACTTGERTTHAHAR